MSNRYLAPTPGTRIAIWIFPALTMWLGLGYLFAPAQRLQSPAFVAARDVMPLKVWGLVFVAVASVKVATLLVGNLRGYMAAMCLGIALYTTWAFLFAVATFADPRTSPGAAAWPLFVVASHVATLATLRRS